MYQIDKERCLGCGGCTITCPNGINIGSDNKAQIIDEGELIKAGGDNVCPYGAIILEVEEEEEAIIAEEEAKEEEEEISF